MGDTQLEGITESQYRDICTMFETMTQMPRPVYIVINTGNHFSEAIQPMFVQMGLSTGVTGRDDRYNPLTDLVEFI